MAEYLSEYITNLALPPAVRPVPHQFAMGDNNAYTFTALVCDTRTPNAGLLGGAVSGTLLRPDGETVVMDGVKGSAVRQVSVDGSGTCNATPCSVTLPQECFAYPGRVTLTIKLTSGTTITQVLAVTALVVRTGTDVIVDPGEIIPDAATLAVAANAALAAAEEATDAAEEATDAASGVSAAIQAANTAAAAATTAAGSVDDAKTAANAAAEAADAAATLANQKATLAQNAASYAQGAGTTAMQAYQSATAAATAANTAATAANTAAESANEAAEAAETVMDGAVRFDETQSLTDAQKAQARTNIGAGTGSLEGAVRYDEAQAITDAQTAQARSNIRSFYAITADNERLNVTRTAKNEWVSGSAVIANSTHLMTEIITVDSWMICAVDSGYQVAAFLYAAGTTNRASYSSLTGWKTTYIVLQPGERYSVALQKSNGGSVTPEDMEHLHIFYGYGRAPYTQTPTLANATSFATIRKPGTYYLAGNIEITSKNLADMPTGYVQSANSFLTVQEMRYNGSLFFLQTLYLIGTPPTQWVRITKSDGTPWNPWTKIMDEPSVTAAVAAGVSAGLNTSVLAGKKVSFYGDSITTFKDSIPSGNVTWYTGSNCGVSSVDDTWWKKLIDALGLTLLVNNSWSGRLVSSHADTWEGRTTNAGYKQANIDVLASGSTNPDIIVILMGLNDFNNEAPLGTYDGTTTLPSDPSTFTNAYAIMLDRIMTTYPLAQVYCCTLTNDDHNPPSVFPEVNGNGVAMSTWNEAIRKLARAFGAKIIDLDQCGITHYNLETYIGDFGDYGIGDGVHPNAAGHSLMANQAIHDMDESVKTRY